MPRVRRTDPSDPQDGEFGDRPLLGLATTRELLHELEVRAMVGRLDPAWVGFGDELRWLERFAARAQELMPAPVLEYRTVDGS